MLVVMFCIALYGYHANVQDKIASREQKSLGTVDQCERRGRGYDNYCHYSFQVGDDWYKGVSKTTSGVAFGQIVDVYYDEQDPRVNSLEDFSERSLTNRRFALLFLLVLAGVVAFVVWDRTPYPKQTR